MKAKVTSRVTKARIAALEYNPKGPSRQVMWDAAMPGFGVRVQPAGTKSFVVLYRIGTRKRLVRLGDVREFQTVEIARQAAAEARRIVRLQDRDPIPTGRGIKVETVADLARSWLDYLKAKGRKDSYISDTRNRLELHVLPKLGRMRPKDVSGAHVEAIHRTISRAGKLMTANRVVALVQAMYSYAARPAVGVLSQSDPNPAKGIERHKERPRKVFVRPAQMPALLDAIDAQPDPYVRAFFLLAILTGARRGELLKLKWADVNVKTGTFTFRDTKSGDDHVLVVSKDAIEIVKDLPRQERNPYVLCGHIHGRPIVNLDKPWRRIKERAGLSEVHIHDLRRTYGTWLATAGRTTQQIGKTLGHKSHVTARVYAEIAEGAKAELASDMAALVRAARVAS